MDARLRCDSLHLSSLHQSEGLGERWCFFRVFLVGSWFYWVWVVIIECDWLFSRMNFDMNEFDYRRIFADRGLRFTKQRCAIFEVLAYTDRHPTAEQLFEMVSDHPVCHGVSLATVYNTLDAFCDAELCVKLPVTHGCARYDANMVCKTNGEDGRMRIRYEPARQPHLHLVDQDSGEIHDVPDELSERLLASIPQSVVREIEEELGYEIRQVSLQFMGRPAGK